eukprot:Nitzschia sp. Nitz4//scaffold142_size57810//28581//32540//NITZ4_006496-RA/size57810-augustus-gene-0.23-mRNA-1//1//CDS//3329536391//7994//frame0
MMSRYGRSDPYPPRHDDRRDGGRGGGGRGGRGGRGPGGGAGRGRRGPGPESFEVKTNLFSLQYLKANTAPADCWYQYQITIIPLIFPPEKERHTFTGPESLKEANELRIKKMQDSVARNGSTPRIRKIMQALSGKLREEGMIIATDQAQMAVSPTALYDHVQKAKTLYINIDPRTYFKINLTFRTTIPLGPLMEPSASADAVSRISQCLGLLWKEAMTRNFIAVGKEPGTYFLPWNDQVAYLRRTFPEYYNNPSSVAPFLGLSSSVRYSTKVGFNVVINNSVGWVFRSSETDPVPVFDPRARTIAGIDIRGDVHQKITSPDVRSQIESLLSKMNFTVSFVKGKAWERYCEKKKREAGYVERHRVFHKPQVRMVSPSNNRRGDDDQPEVEKPRIKWSCDEETFERNGKTVNVAEYLEDVYDVKIRFPNMPIIGIKRGYYPVEFFFQEFSRSPGNDPSRVQKVLKYHDEYAGLNRINHVKDLARLASSAGGEQNSLQSLLNDFNLKLQLEPLVVKARRLPAPELKFACNDTESSAYDGSWNLQNKAFYSPADLTSYAVVDFTSGGRPSVRDVVGALFRAMQRHGMRILNNGERHLDSLIIRADPRRNDQILDALQEAKRRAQSIFTQSFFYTQVLRLDGIVESCWVGREKGSLFAIPLSDRDIITHRIKNRASGSWADAKIAFIDPNGNFVAPADVPCDAGPTEFGFIIPEYGPVPMSEISETEINPILVLEPFQIECPAQIIVYLPENTTQLYDMVKTISDLSLDVNTQCIVQATAGRQKRLEQYCSNLALKLNSKLYNKDNRAKAWSLGRNAAWTEEKPTMVIGYAFSHGRIGGNAATSVGGCTCLSSNMSIGQTVKFFRSDLRAEGVPESVLKGLVNELLLSYRKHVGTDPQRVLVFREGGSSGSFDHVRNVELQWIRECFGQVPFTLVVSNEDHNVRIVPDSFQNSVRGNVPSGTFIDDGFGDSIEQGESGFEILITPQGGLKGTSKPMMYQCIVNENKDLTKQLLSKVIYDMSFQYGTATKSPRKVPVLLYSDKIANRAMKYGGTLASVLQYGEQYEISEDSREFVRVGDVGEKRNGNMLGMPFRPHLL